jgi:crotonobetainyl-CoA:carnitine CoA-transferase CaiB-like acyl-CoA transferase
MGGLMSVTGEPDGAPGGGPMKVGVAIVDIFTGMYASTAVLAALAHRERTGEGQHIDLALFDVQVATLANQAMNFLVAGDSPRRLGNAHPNIVPYQACPTADGHIILAVGNDSQFRKFCAVAGCPELADDPRYTTNAARVNNRQELMPLLEEALKKRPSADWIRLLESAGVPCGPINTLAEVFALPQVEARQMRIELEHPTAGQIPLVGNPMKFSRTPVVYRQPPPVLGEHNPTILRDLLQLSTEECRRLEQAGVIGASPTAARRAS